MAKGPFKWWLWTKLIVVGGVISVGGPYFVSYLTPTSEEIFEKYSPDLQLHALRNKEKREREFDDFVTTLKEASRSDKHIWIALDEMKKAKQKEARRRMRQAHEDATYRSQRMRLDAGLVLRDR